MWFLQALLVVTPAVMATSRVQELAVLMPHVKPPKPETYFCTSVRLPEDDGDIYVVGFEPNATMDTAHHMLLYGCETPGTDQAVWSCGDMAVNNPGVPTGPLCRGNTQIIYAWAKNAPKLEMPEGVAFRVGKRAKVNYLSLQVHYADVTPFTDGSRTDDSGVVVEYTRVPQPKSAGVYVLGTMGSIPAESRENMETACRIKEDKVLHPFAFRTHTHALGEVVSGWRVRRDSYGLDQWTLIGKMNPQLPQMFYPVLDQLTVTNGDVLAARCAMNNHRKTVTTVGPTSENEMCNFYMMYWTDGEPLTSSVCFSFGPPYYYWHNNHQRSLNNIPDSASSISMAEVRRYLF